MAGRMPSPEFSSASGSVSTTSYYTATASSPSNTVVASCSSSVYKISETIRVRERLAELNSKDLRHYFRGIRKLNDELLAKKGQHEVEEIVHRENLSEFQRTLHTLRESLTNSKKDVNENNSEFARKFDQIIDEMRKGVPELAEKIEDLHQMQCRLAYLKFSRNLTILRDEIRRNLRKGNYPHMLENYRKLLKIPGESPEYCIDDHCRREYGVKAASLSRFLQLELRSALSNLFARIHFPFEEPVDFNTLHLPLVQSAQLLRCLHLVNSELATAAESGDVTSQEGPIEFVLDEFTKRFFYHFYGDRPTNNAAKPEWFYTQLSYWAENNIEYFEQHIQPFIGEMFSEGFNDIKSAKDLFLQHLMKLASQKVGDILRSSDRISEDRLKLSHLIDESVLFEKEIQENYGYPEEAPVHVVSELCKVDEVLEMWIKLERDTLSTGIDSILADNEAYEPRYQEAADVDQYLVPNFADFFVILMQSMSERYRSIPNLRLQCRFLNLQLIIVDEFRSRIVQIGQHLQHNPWTKPYPQLMNALWYLTLVLDDWSDSPEYVRLQFFLQQISVSSAGCHSSPSSAINSLARGTFDESASLYRHVWRQRVRNLIDVFLESIRSELVPYAGEKWYALEGTTKPADVTPSLEPFLRKVQELIGWIIANISPDSVLTLHHLTNHEVWSALNDCVVSQTAFNYRGAAQLLHDVTNAIIPLLNSCYGNGNVEGASGFDVFSDKCVSVLSTIRLLSLTPPTAILLKDEVKHIPEQQLNEKLEQFNIIGMTKARVLEVLEQRCDLILLEKLIS